MLTAAPSSPVAPSADRTLWTIQYLRGIAALMVVWHHSRGQLERYAGLLPQHGFGASGVDLFFVISGFIMVLTTHGKSVTPGQFLHRRIVRVVPLYWLLTLLVVVMAHLVPGLFKTTHTHWWHVLQSLLFIPHASPAHPGKAWPLLVPGWTLNYEMFFYLVFGMSLWLSTRWRLAVVVGTLFALVAFGWWAGPFESVGLQFYTRYLLLEFAIGMLIAHWWLGRGSAWPLWAAWLMLLVGALLLALREQAPMREFNQVLGASLVVLGALCPQLLSCKNRFWQSLGDASYSIYLTHLFTLGVLRVVWVQLFPDVRGAPWAWSFMGLALAGSAAVGWLSWRWIEQPLLHKLR